MQPQLPPEYVYGLRENVEYRGNTKKDLGVLEVFRRKDVSLKDKLECGLMVSPALEGVAGIGLVAGSAINALVNGPSPTAALCGGVGMGLASLALISGFYVYMKVLEEGEPLNRI